MGTHKDFRVVSSDNTLNNRAPMRLPLYGTMVTWLIDSRGEGIHPRGLDTAQVSGKPDMLNFSLDQPTDLVCAIERLRVAIAPIVCWNSLRQFCPLWLFLHVDARLYIPDQIETCINTASQDPYLFGLAVVEHVNG